MNVEVRPQHQRKRIRVEGLAIYDGLKLLEVTCSGIYPLLSTGGLIRPVKLLCVTIRKAYVFMYRWTLDIIELDPLSLERGDMVIKNPPCTHPWEILRLEPLPRTQLNSCQGMQMERGPLQVRPCHRCSSFLICSEDTFELRLGWICVGVQQRSETIDQTGG
jgi:hypothetical protein